MITNLKAEKIEVRYSAKRIATGAPKETGSFWYKVTGSVNLSDTEAARLTARLDRTYEAGSHIYGGQRKESKKPGCRY
jgi:hypothetical protein